MTTNWIDKAEFFTRAEVEKPVQHGKYTTWRDNRKLVEKLYVAGYERKDDVERLCSALETSGVKVLFVDNVIHPAFSPELRLKGNNHNLLVALSVLLDVGTRLDKFRVNGNTIDLWWD